MAGAPLLKLQGLYTDIGPYQILHGVDLCAREGRTTMLLGRNGAGKTTTFRTIMGFYRARAGEILFDERPMQNHKTPDIARRGVGYVPEQMDIFGDLSVRENMLLAARAGAPDALRLQWIFGFFPALERFWNTRAGALSGGQKQMLAIARAIIEPRRLLLIDEPTKGLAPTIVNSLIACLEELKRQGATILLVEQNFHLASRVGDDVYVMDDGKIVHHGAMAELVADALLQQRLLGLSLGEHQ